jgi:tetratricopeptide (TPR) repeat protein
MGQDSVAEMNLAGYEGWGMAMSAYPVEKTTPVPTTRSSAGGTDPALHAQDSDRVYQAAGNQYIFDQALPAPAAARNTLPRDITAFAGRGGELNDLIFAITELVANQEIIPIHVISGMPGVGKTTFALRAAHRLSASFPGGQMFVDLYAHTAGRKPVEPTEALFALLAVDGVPFRDIPDDVDGRAALWRARMAGRRSVLLLDNVASHRQVEPLLPGAAGCLVLVTSRRRLTGLGARHAAATLPLNPLLPGPAADLFASLTGRTPGDKQERVVAELVRLCGYLPLAISLLAARLRPEPQWQVQTLVDDLVAARDRLAYIRAEDIQVEAAFQLSYQRLPSARRRFFRRLGLSPGTDIDIYAAAALGGVEPQAARRHLDALYDDHLVDQPVQGRYRLHDLLSAYARTLVAKDPDWQRDQAVRRLLDYYEHAAAAADRHIALRPHQTPDGGHSQLLVATPALADGRQAVAWMEAELPNLLACATYAVSKGDDDRLISMSSALATFLRRAGPYQQSIALHRAAADAARRLGDRSTQATALYQVGVLLRRAGDYSAAIRVLSEARSLYRDLDDRVSEADVLTVTGIVRRLAGDYPTACEMLDEALACFRELNDTIRQAEVLSELAVIRWLTEDYRAATQLLDQALILHRGAGNRSGQANVLLNLAVLRQLTHDPAPATHALDQATVLYQSLGSQVGLAHTQFVRGAVCRLTGDYPAATDLLDESLCVYRDIDDCLGQANTLTEMGIVRRLTVDHGGATQALQEALSLYRSLGNRRGQAAALRELGVVSRLTGNTVEATEDLTRALTIYQDLGSRSGQAEVLNDLAELLYDDGDPQALDRFQAALGLARDVGDPMHEGRALWGIGRCHLRQDDTQQAIPPLRAALEIYERIGAPDATQVRAMLTSLNVNR